MISKTIEFKLNKETPKIIIASNTGFEKIEMLEVIGNQINKIDAPLGIRWTLVYANKKYDCFCWQLPGKFEFNCFELMDVFGFIDTNLANKYVTKQSSELHVNMEDRVFEEGLEIGIMLEVREFGGYSN